MDRALFIEHQTWMADRRLGFTEGEEEARERFLQLAIDTYDHLVASGADRVWAFDPSPEAAGNGLFRSN